MTINADPPDAHSAPVHPEHELDHLDRAHQPWFARLGRFAARRRKRVMLAWLLVALLAAPLAITVEHALSGAGWDAAGSTSAKVRDELRRDFPQVGAESAVVVVHQDVPVSQDPSAVRQLVADLAGAPGAAQVVDPLSIPPEAGMVSQDGRTILVPVDLWAKQDADRPESAGKLIDFVDKVSLPNGATAEVTGEWAVWSDFNKANSEALHFAELLSGVPTMILLVVAFGALVAAGLPLLLAIAGMAVSFAVLHLIGIGTPTSVWSMNFSMMIGLAVGIDYSLFIVSRYREEREDGKSATEAVAATLNTAGKAVFLSALAVVLSLGAIFVVPVMVFRSMALGMILSVVAVAFASLTLLPAVLVALGDRVLVKKEKDHDRGAEGRWARWTGKALKRPGITLAIGLAVLLALAAPALGMKLGMPGARVVDEGRSSRDGYDQLVAAFGPGAAAPIFVTVPAGEAPQVVAIAQADRGVMDARVVAEPAATTGRTVVRVTPTTPVDDQATMDLVTRLREDVGAAVPDALVGGPASQNHDLTDVLIGRAPLAIGAIMVVAFVLLLVVFRSLTIAVSSIFLNLISVAASFGFATIVFQHGIGAGLLGIHHQGFVDAWAPLFFFALLFGLSMDYNLFLLAAIRERYEDTEDTQRAIRDGIARTGRPITNAALIMIVVFVAFGVTGPIPPTELGVTLALAVLLDATVIRMMLVPSLMGLLGDRNWWLPGWLDRRLPKVEFSH